MVRPKSEDPTVAVQFRMKKSAHDWWQKRADDSGMKLHKLLQGITEHRAEAERRRLEFNGAITAKDIQENTVVGVGPDGRTELAWERDLRLNRNEVSPNFKGKS